MDFHFWYDESGKSSRLQGFEALDFIKKFLPVFVLFFFLPFLVMLVMRPSELRFIGRADQNDELRMWLEPSTVVMESGDSTTLKVVASFEHESRVIPALTYKVVPVGFLKPDRMDFRYQKPFRGQVTLGEVVITGLQAGDFEVSIPKESIEVENYDYPLEIVTSSSRIIVNI